eukprot:SAG31_NODE_10935_length_1081_cov_35.668024_1_plen_121_part_10
MYCARAAPRRTSDTEITKGVGRRLPTHPALGPSRMSAVGLTRLPRRRYIITRYWWVERRLPYARDLLRDWRHAAALEASTLRASASCRSTHRVRPKAHLPPFLRTHSHPPPQARCQPYNPG